MVVTTAIIGTVSGSRHLMLIMTHKLEFSPPELELACPRTPPRDLLLRLNLRSGIYTLWPCILVYAETWSLLAGNGDPE